MVGKPSQGVSHYQSSEYCCISTVYSIHRSFISLPLYVMYSIKYSILYTVWDSVHIKTDAGAEPVQQLGRLPLCQNLWTAGKVEFFWRVFAGK